jgi:hypothetical protein
VASPRVPVTVRATSTGALPWAGRVTSPVAVTTAGSLLAQVNVVPCRPEAGRVRLPRTSSGWTSSTASTAACALPASSCSSASTVTAKGPAVRETSPRVTVAVSVASPSGAPYAGRCTVPSASTTEASLVAQEIVVPRVPVVGSTRSDVTALVSPRSRSAASASAAAVLVSAALAEASSPVRARE